PSGVAFSNGAKLLVLAATLPFVLDEYGINAALAVFILAEVVRYAVLVWRKHRVGISFTRQDVVATIVFVGMICAFRELTMVLGLTEGVGEWIAQANVFHG
ncbi:MAG: hypothetical protein WBO17_13070, partial [Sphingorhabdus sp.]